MSRVLIKQPDGKYAEWSTIMDDFYATDMSEDEYIKFKGEEAKYRAEVEAVESLERLQLGKRIEMTWEEALEILKDNQEQDEEDK